MGHFAAIILSILMLCASIGAGVFFVNTATSDQGNASLKSTLNSSSEARQKLATFTECSVCTGGENDSTESVTGLIAPAPTPMQVPSRVAVAVSNVIFSLGTKRFSVAVSPHKTVGYVLSKAKQLLSKNQFPDKFPFALWFGRVLNEKDTLASIGIRNGNTLLMSHKGHFTKNKHMLFRDYDIVLDQFRTAQGDTK